MSQILRYKSYKDDRVGSFHCRALRNVVTVTKWQSGLFFYSFQLLDCNFFAVRTQNTLFTLEKYPDIQCANPYWGDIENKMLGI